MAWTRSCARILDSSARMANGKEAMVGLLLEHGAKRDARSDSGKTPYDLPMEHGQHRVADLLKA